jgi:hypothetical protein
VSKRLQVVRRRFPISRPGRQPPAQLLVVVTAAPACRSFPQCHGASYLEERTYKALLAPFGSTAAVWAECLFADPIADIAVLGTPDDQVLFDEAAAYEALVESATPLSIADAPEKGHAWLLSLSGK